MTKASYYYNLIYLMSQFYFIYYTCRYNVTYVNYFTIVNK